MKTLNQALFLALSLCIVGNVTFAASLMSVEAKAKSLQADREKLIEFALDTSSHAVRQ